MSCSEKATLVVLASCFVLLGGAAFAQDASISSYMNPKLSPQERAADLVHRMTLEEKASQLVNDARVIPRLDL